MIYLRCPHHGCPIEVADDMLGARIRCPHCEQLLFVEAQHQQPSEPPPEPKPDAVAAGMPPLAAMLGIREGRGRHWGDGGRARANMTDLDWQALAAFEKVVYAVIALKTAIGFGIAAMLFTALLWIGAANATSWETELTPARLLTRVPALAILCMCFVLMALGRHRLARVRFGTLTTLATCSTLAVPFVFAADAMLTLLRLFYVVGGPAGPVALAVPLQLVAAFCAARAFVRMRRAQQQASPYPIRHRLIAALDYLDWIEREEQLWKR